MQNDVSQLLARSDVSSQVCWGQFVQTVPNWTITYYQLFAIQFTIDSCHRDLGAGLIHED